MLETARPVGRLNESPLKRGEGLSFGAQRHEQLPVGGELSHRVVAVVHTVDSVVGADADAVGIAEHLSAPRLEEIPFPVEDHHAVVAPGEGVHPVLAVHRHVGGFLQRHPIRQTSPSFRHLKAQSAAAHYCSHGVPPLVYSCQCYDWYAYLSMRRAAGKPLTRKESEEWI